MLPLRLVFAGSPAAAVPSLDALVASMHEVVAVVTREDSPQGRRGILTPTPVALAALGHGIPVIKANNLTGAATTAIATLSVDLGVIVAFGGLVREPLLSTPPHGWINLHFSELPRWRGAAPVQRAIIAGDTVTGASVFQLVAELDAGDVFAITHHDIAENATAGSLLESLSHSGAQLLSSVVDAIADGSARATAQRGDVSLAPKLTLADGVIDWSAAAHSVHNQIRGVTPEPGASTMLDGQRLKVLEARLHESEALSGDSLSPGQFGLVGGSLLVGTGTAAIELIRVQPAGKNAMNAADWWRGKPHGSTAVADPLRKDDH